MVRNSFEFLDLAAVPSTPKPAFDDPDQMDEGDPKSGDALLSNWQFTVLGAFLGIIATIIYYQMARFC